MPATPSDSNNAHNMLPALADFENRQLILFQTFLHNTDVERDQLSNAIDLWDSVPRYTISRQAMSKIRIDKRFLEKYETKFQHRGRFYVVTITPARVKDLDGKEREFYPSATEELVEDALRKLAADQHAGWFDKSKPWSGVVFSLYALRQELKRRGHTRSYSEIVLALEILNKSNIEITNVPEPGQPSFTTSEAYLPHLTRVTRGLLCEDPNAKWLVRFHTFVALSIDEVTYRQFNYHLMMSHTTQLARWLHKQLALKYTFASLMNSFETRYSTIKRDSGLLDNYRRERDAIEALQQAFTELKKHQVLLNVARKNVVGPRGKLLDVIFSLTPSPKFIYDMKASNKRINNTQAVISSKPFNSAKAVGIARGS